MLQGGVAATLAGVALHSATMGGGGLQFVDFLWSPQTLLRIKFATQRFRSEVQRLERAAPRPLTATLWALRA